MLFINVFYLNVNLVQQDVTSGFSFLVTSKETEFCFDIKWN